MEEFGLNDRISRKNPFLFLKQRLKRFNWAKTNVNWTTQKWDSVIWSDETKISLFRSDGLKYVRRRYREDIHHDCSTPTVKDPECHDMRLHDIKRRRTE